jgi:hypothetical protein
MPDCIVCQTQDAERELGQDARFDCRRCGAFVLTGTAEATLPTKLEDRPLRRSLMSHTLRRMQQPDDQHLRQIREDDLPTFWRNERLPTPQQQADNLILWIGDNQEASFSFAITGRQAIAAWIGLPISPPDDFEGWEWLHSEMDGDQFYQSAVGKGAVFRLRLTMRGWEQYESLKRRETESRTAFMAMKFNEDELDRVMAKCFRPAVTRAGFELRLITDQQPAGLIDNQLRAAILASRFLIADLTHGSPGAYWEAGFGEGLGLPVIYTCEKAAWKEKHTHFDTNHLLTIIWDLEELKKAEDALTATIRATLRAHAKQTDD